MQKLIRSTTLPSHRAPTPAGQDKIKLLSERELRVVAGGPSCGTGDPNKVCKR
jgi:hypothetical protein